MAASATRLADIYEAKLDLAVRRFLTILEPLVILLVSTLAGLIVLSIISAVMGVFELTGT